MPTTGVCRGQQAVSPLGRPAPGVAADVLRSGCGPGGGIAGRYGTHLFHCFDDPELPATTNQLEGAFGKTKHQARRALGCGSTTHSLVHNLGDEFLLAHHQVTAGTLDLRAEPIDPQAYRQARAKLREQEQPARQRRSFVRRLGSHLKEILSRWMAVLF